MGTVLEANLEVGRGPVATVMVQKGLLAVGDPVVAGAAYGKVKALINDQGKQIKSAGPSTPVQILGFSEPPFAGDEMRVAHDLAHARSLAEARAQRARLIGHQPVASTSGARLEDLFEQIQRGETATLNIVLKADVQGSLEACTESLRKLERDDVKLVIVHRGVGGITENDVQLAKASNATIIGFNVRPDKRSRELAESEGVRDPHLRDHLQADRGDRVRDAGPALAGLRRGRHGRGRSPRGLPRAADRGDRRLLRARRRHHARVQGPLPARGHHHLEGHRSRRCVASRRTRARCRRASSAASASRTTRTSSRATSSRRSKSARFPRTA